MDFSNWVDDWANGEHSEDPGKTSIYQTFLRRRSFFNEIPYDGNLNVGDKERFLLIPDGVIYEGHEEKVDHLIVDEAQDYNIGDYLKDFIPHKKKSISLFGDSSQGITTNAISMDEISKALGYNTIELKCNYRLPLSVARVAQLIYNNNSRDKIDLLKYNKHGEKNEENKPIISRFSSEREELEWIADRINNNAEKLEDVAIIVHYESDVEKVYDFLRGKEIKCQVLYRTNRTQTGNVFSPFKTINTIDFKNSDIPCVLTFMKAKGTEFENVFVPFANDENGCNLKEFYVACTRSSKNLFISYTGKRSHFLNDIMGHKTKRI